VTSQLQVALVNLSLTLILMTVKSLRRPSKRAMALAKRSMPAVVESKEEERDELLSENFYFFN